MGTRHIMVAAFALAATASCMAQEGYICLSDKSTGFRRTDSQAWVATNFKTDGQKFLLALKGGAWKWSEFGKDDLFTGAECGSFSEYGYLRCTGLGTELVFNRKNLRFQMTFQGGYITEGVVDPKYGFDTPYLTIGSCSKL